MNRPNRQKHNTFQAKIYIDLLQWNIYIYRRSVEKRRNVIFFTVKIGSATRGALLAILKSKKSVIL
jgi:hypothetical protein